jgi:bacillithiol biosynthesis deacetylase BshB1
MKVDVLAFGAHPDDIELGASGTIVKLAKAGKKVGLVDLTSGEMGTRGNSDSRREEATEAAKVLGVLFRDQMDLGDARIENNVSNQNEVIQILRKYRPDVVLANTLSDRHIDHGKAARLVADSCFLSGLSKWESKDGGESQSPWRPQMILHYVQDHYHRPSLVVDITGEMHAKLLSIQTFKSQFFNPDSLEPETPISTLDFMEFIKCRAREMGRIIGATFGEGFICETPLNPMVIRTMFPV